MLERLWQWSHQEVRLGLEVSIEDSYIVVPGKLLQSLQRPTLLNADVFAAQVFQPQHNVLDD